MKIKDAKWTEKGSAIDTFMSGQSVRLVAGVTGSEKGDLYIVARISGHTYAVNLQHGTHRSDMDTGNRFVSVEAEVVVSH